MADEQEDDLPTIRRFLLDVVDSFEKLEIVVYVTRAPTPMPTVPSIADALGLTPRVVAEGLAELAQRTVLVMSDRGAGGWTLDLDGPWAGAASAMTKLYDEDRVKVLDLMARTAVERVRSQAARAFADAFVLRSTKKNSDG